MASPRANSDSLCLPTASWVRWVCCALVAVLSFGPGGLERAHVGVSHDHVSLASHDRDFGLHGDATPADTSDLELSAPCDTCRDLQLARLSQTGTGSAILSWSPAASAVDRFVSIAEQVRSIASPAHIRSRAPPTT